MSKILFFTLTLLTTLFCQAEGNIPAPYFYNSQEEHQITILEEGPASFMARLELIAKAETSIDIEYFIFKPDRIGQLLVQALKTKAREGVKVRILIDKSPLAPPLSADVSYLLSLYGIEVRYFNPITFLSLGRAFHRTHRKMLIVDGQEVITGGRNIGEEYFLRNKNFSFLDRDILLVGPIVEGMKESFEAYWKSDFSVAPRLKNYHRRKNIKGNLNEQKSVELRHRRLRKAWNFFSNMTKAQALMQEIAASAETYPLYTQPHLCNDIEFASDGPEKNKDTRYFAPYFYNLLENTQHTLDLQTPYFITLKRDKLLLQNLLDKGISINLITNSTKSNNHPIVSNVLNRRIDGWVRKGMNAYFMTGEKPTCFYCPESEQTLVPQADGITYGLHSKSTLIDKEKSLFITYNLDPQSQVRSLEMGIVCHQGPEVASELDALFESHKEVAFTFDSDGRPLGEGGLLRGTTVWEKVTYFFRILPSFLLAPLL